MGAKIQRVRDREALHPRREPYWEMRETGKYVGYRKMTADGGGTWVARFRRLDGGHLTHSLGPLDSYPPSEQFDRACQAADEWFKHVSTGGESTNCTVAQACENYVLHIEHKRGDKSAKDLAARYKRLIDLDPVGDIELLKLNKAHIRDWRQRITAKPAVRGGKQTDDARSKDTVNRDMAALRAALNFAKGEGLVGTDTAWKKALEAFEKATKRRTLYLDREQRRALINHAAKEVEILLKAMTCLPLRPGALAALTVGDVDTRLGELRVGQDKHGQDRRLKLPHQVMNFLNMEVKDKLPGAPLFSRADGSAWNKDKWKLLLKSAAQAAGLPSQTTAYTLRHSVITDLVIDRVDLLTVAQISGTSVAMIEKHYGHLRNDIVSDALAKLVV